VILLYSKKLFKIIEVLVMITFTKSYKLLMVFILIIIVTVISCEKQPNEPNNNENTITGVIVDEQGTGIAFAVISVYNPSIPANNDIVRDTTDEEGVFLLSKLPADDSQLNVKIQHQDFKIFEEKLSSFKLKITSPIILCHEDTCKGVINFGTFKLSDSSKLSDVVIKIYRSGTLIKKGNTYDGKLTFTNVCPGDYIIQYNKQNYSASNDSISINSSDTVYIHKYFEQLEPDSCCNGKIVISIKDSAANSALSGVKTYLSDANGHVNYTYSDSLGIATLTGICPGDYKVNFYKSGYNSQSLTFNMNCNDSAGANVILAATPKADSCCNGALKVFLIDKITGKSPANKVSVNLLQNGKVLQTQSSNVYAFFSKLCEGSYQIHITSSYYETLTFDYTSHCNAQDTTTKFLTPTQSGDSCCHGIINITYKDSASQAALKGVGVYLYQGSAKIAAQSTDAHGNVAFTGICQGDFTVKSSLSGYNNYYFSITLGCNDSNSSVQYISKVKSTDSCCTGKLTVSVKDSTDGNPVSGATVYIIRLDNSTTITGTTDSNGTYTAEGLCAPVNYKIKATRSDYNYYYVPLTFYHCNSQAITIKILKK
jgi:5-hydroxyisourate hydrolase-like protein (transthyretin family)